MNKRLWYGFKRAPNPSTTPRRMTRVGDSMELVASLSVLPGFGVGVVVAVVVAFVVVVVVALSPSCSGQVDIRVHIVFMRLDCRRRLLLFRAKGTTVENTHTHTHTHHVPPTTNKTGTTTPQPNTNLSAFDTRCDPLHRSSSFLRTMQLPRIRTRCRYAGARRTYILDARCTPSHTRRCRRILYC